MLTCDMISSSLLFNKLFTTVTSDILIKILKKSTYNAIFYLLTYVLGKLTSRKFLNHPVFLKVHIITHIKLHL